MRLTLRTMLAYLDDVLTEADSHELGQKIDSSDFATGLVHRIRNSISQLRLSSPELLGSDSMDDPNTVAEFIDSSLSPEKEQEFEKVCLQSDKHLAEVASSHQILTMVLGTPARVSPRLRDRVYRNGIPGDGADSPVPARTGRRDAFRRAEVTDAALAIEDEGPIDIKRPRPMSDSRAALAEFGQRRNLWPIAAAVLLGFILTGGFLFAMGPLNSSHPLAGLLGLSDVQVAENTELPAAELPAAELAEQLQAPAVVVPTPANGEFATEIPAQPVVEIPVAPGFTNDVAVPVVPQVDNSQFPALEQPNSEWEVPGQANVDDQVPEFDQIPDFPPAESLAPETQVAEAAGDEDAFFNTPDLIPGTPGTPVSPAVVAGQANPADDLPPFPELEQAVNQPQGDWPADTRTEDGPALGDPPAESVAGLRDPSARPTIEDNSIGFGDPLVAAEETPPVPDTIIPGIAIPDPNTLADNNSNKTIFDEPLESDPALPLENDTPLAEVDSNDAGLVDMSADDDPVVEDAVAEPEPEAQAEAGRFLSEDQVLLYWDDQTGTWMRLAPRTAFGVGHRLRMLENYRTQLLLAPGNIQIASRGDSEISFAEPIDAQTPALDVPFGRFMLNSTAQGGSRFALQAGNRIVAIEFAEPNTEVVCQVRPVLLPGVDPRREPPHETVHFWVTRGSVKIMEGDREEQVDMGQQYAFADDLEARVSSFDRVPEWLTKRIDPVDRDVAMEIDGLLPVGRDIVLSLTEAADSRRTDVRSWAMRHLVSLDEYRTSASLFSVADRKHQHAWPALFDEFRAAIARGRDSAVAVQRTFTDLYGADGAKLYRMLLGYDNDQLKAGAADQLVEDLAHPRVEFRILAIQNLKRITAKTLTYSPVLGEKFRATKVTRWKNELKKGKVLMTTPANGVLSPGQRDLSVWNSLTSPVLP